MLTNEVYMVDLYRSGKEFEITSNSYDAYINNESVNDNDDVGNNYAPPQPLSAVTKKDY